MSGKASVASAALSTLSAFVVLWRGGTSHDGTAKRLDALAAWLEEPDGQTCASRQACALTYGELDTIVRTVVGVCVLVLIFYLWRRDVASRGLVQGTPVVPHRALQPAEPLVAQPVPAGVAPAPLSLADLQTYRPPSRRK